MANRINKEIKSNEIRLVKDGKSEIVKLEDAIKLAEKEGLDLVEIASSANPPVCKIIDYSKFLYQQKKKEKENKKKQTNIEIKELRFGPQTGEHDFQFKVKHAIEFLKSGNKVRAYVYFKGRSVMFKEQGEVILLKLAQSVEDYGNIENMPNMERNKMFMLIKPKTKK